MGRCLGSSHDDDVEAFEVHFPVGLFHFMAFVSTQSETICIHVCVHVHIPVLKTGYPGVLLILCLLFGCGVLGLGFLLFLLLPT